MLEGNTHLADMAQRKEGENRRGYGRHCGAHTAGNKEKLSRRGIWFTSLTPVLTTCHDLMSMECTGGNCCHCRFALTLISRAGMKDLPCGRFVQMKPQ